MRMDEVFIYGYQGDDMYDIPEEVDWEGMLGDESQRHRIPKKVRELEEAAHRKLAWLKGETTEHNVALRKLQRIKLRYEKSEIVGQMAPHRSSAYGITDDELVYTIDVLLTIANPSPVKTVLKQTAKRFERPIDWVDRVLKYEPRKTQFDRVLHKLCKAHPDIFRNLKKYKLYNLNLWLKSGSISSLLIQIKKACALISALNEKDDEIRELHEALRERDDRIASLFRENDAKVKISKVDEAKKLKKSNPKMSYEEIGNRIGVTRQTAANYCKQ